MVVRLNGAVAGTSRGEVPRREVRKEGRGRRGEERGRTEAPDREEGHR